MQYPKSHIIKKLRMKADHAVDRAILRDRQEQERQDEAMDQHRATAPTVRELLKKAEKILGNPHATPDQYRQVKDLIRDAGRTFGGGNHIPKRDPESNAYRGTALDLNGAADLLESSTGDTVSTSELERLGLLRYLRV